MRADAHAGIHGQGPGWKRERGFRVLEKEREKGTERKERERGTEREREGEREGEGEELLAHFLAVWEVEEVRTGAGGPPTTRHTCRTVCVRVHMRPRPCGAGGPGRPQPPHHVARHRPRAQAGW